MRISEIKKMRTKIGSLRPRRLLLCLDGVPFEIIRQAREQGLFTGFNSPAKLLSPFPTMTNIALSVMLKASAPPGYESLYFDRATLSLQGGVRKYLGWRTPDKIPSSYMRELDYQEPLACEFLIYVAPQKVWRADFRRFHERFRASPQDRDFFAFLKATDGLLHIGGASRLLCALQSLDEILREIIKRDGAGTEIVLFSDHGMNLFENKRTFLKSHLRRFGYVHSARLSADDSRVVSIPAFGLCSYAAVYCAEEETARIADCLTTLEGVDFSLYREEEAAVIKGERGTARIHQRKCACGGGETYRYELIEGDPLELAHISDDLMRSGNLDGDGYATDAAWSVRTLDHIYPNALSNLYGAICHARVQNTANVLISLRDGYFYGASAFVRMARLLATHGNAMRASSTAFMMSTHRRLSSFVLAEEAHDILRNERFRDTCEEH
jgi:hypothetical protein